MGLYVDKSEFEEAEFVRFDERLAESLTVLEALLARPGFGEGPTTLGAEIEMALIDASGRPEQKSAQVLGTLSDERFTVELDRFNLECNTTPHRLSGTVLGRMAGEFDDAVSAARAGAAAHGADVALIGILPTLERGDLDASAMTDAPRYRALNRALKQQRHGPFTLRVDGSDPLSLDWNDVTLEGANTSLQIHLRVAPADFARLHAAVQLATAPALAVSANSPTFLGHDLWEETRIVLFKQAVDARTPEDPAPRIARVSFGTGWVKNALEPFAESVHVHHTLLPVMSDEDPAAVLSAGGVPALGELRLHHGTVWRWNRAIYDPSAGGHVRIEMRALPSGPTVVDMVANTAFLVGLALDLADAGDDLASAFPFDEAENNFYRAAQSGPGATLGWPTAADGIARLRAGGLAASLVDRAKRALERRGLDEGELDESLEILFERATRGATGARWQRRRLEALGVRFDRTESLRRMLLDYVARSREGAPVHTWDAS